MRSQKICDRQGVTNPWQDTIKYRPKESNIWPHGWRCLTSNDKSTRHKRCRYRFKEPLGCANSMQLTRQMVWTNNQIDWDTILIDQWLSQKLNSQQVIFHIKSRKSSCNRPIHHHEKTPMEKITSAPRQINRSLRGRERAVAETVLRTLFSSIQVSLNMPRNRQSSYRTPLNTPTARPMTSSYSRTSTWSF